MSDLNGVMMQSFHWYVPCNGMHWCEISQKATELAEAGFTAMWLPPAYKGVEGSADVGYGAYDLYDLGEFQQQGTIGTKYGTREQYLTAIETLRSIGIQVYADAVLNHKDGADAAERIRATPYLKNNRLKCCGRLQPVEAYTCFTFPGRNGKYSTMQWNWQHFDAVNYNHLKPDERNLVYLLEGKSFDNFVSLEKENYSFLWGCDLDIENPAVRAELVEWGKWYLDTTSVDGFRLDAIKHISSWFFADWIDQMRQYAQRDLFFVGEYWSADLDTLNWYLDAMGRRMSVFDVPLHFNFHQASRSSGRYDMRRILDNTLMQRQPTFAVTFVDNHDSQPLQTLESVIEAWFKPLAYAIILLRREGYPCVFYADYYGAHYIDRGFEIWLDCHRWLIDKFLYARRHYAYGEQIDYFDHPDRVGWTRLGDETHPQGMAVLLSDGDGGSKWMNVGKPNRTFFDLTEHVLEPVQTNEWGWGEFFCLGGSVSVWVQA